MADTYDLVVIGTGVAATKRGCDPKTLLSGVAATVDQARRFADDGFAAKGTSLSSSPSAA